MNFYFEPYIFAVDASEIDQCKFEKYINTLIGWEEFSKMEWGQIYLLTSTFECLLNNGYYPFIDNLKVLIQKYNVTHIGASDVDRILNKFLMKFPKIEDTIPLLNNYIGCDTNSDLSHRPEVFNQELCKLSSLLSLKTTLNFESEDENVIFTRDLTNVVEFKSKIETLSDESPIHSHYLVKSYSCFESFFGFCSDITTPKIIWKNAKSNTELEIGIRIKLLQECKYDCIEHSYENHSFNFQKSFFNWILDLNLKSVESKLNATLRSVSDVILGKNKQEIHWLRVGKGAKDPQVKYESFCAWRKDIDDEYHIHYWCNGQMLIFADVVPHKIVTITNLVL